MSEAGDGLIPTALGRYRVVRRIGTGGMSEVFLARSVGAEGIEKTLVVKRILPQIARRSKFISMFLDEAKLAMRLNHPNVVQVYAFEEVRGEFLLAMEFVDGVDLARLCSLVHKSQRNIAPALAAYIVGEVANGLEYAHNRKDERGRPLEIVHRDVSPQNVLVGHEGAVKITDFGIAHARTVSEASGVVKGKVAYMAPEQARGEAVDRRADVYGLGVMLAELLLGRPLFQERSAQRVFERVAGGDLPDLATLLADAPPELTHIAQTAMRAERQERYVSARALSRALTAFLREQPEIVDAATLETLLEELAPRPVPNVEASALRDVSTASSSPPLSARTQPESGVAPGPRERRVVVTLSGCLSTRSAAFQSAGASAQRVLEEMAFKVDAVLHFQHEPSYEQRRFRFVLGLGRTRREEPLRAAQLALDVVEALSALSPEQPSALSCAIGLSRGVVATVRDALGRLLSYEPEDAVFALADALAESGRPPDILAAGEVYRSARREFVFDDQSPRDVALSLGLDLTPQGVRAYPLRAARGPGELDTGARNSPQKRPLIGRADLLARVHSHYAAALGAQVSAGLFVLGDLGVGKTALLSGALEALSPAPRTLYLECRYGAALEPLSSARELTRRALTSLFPGESPATTLARLSLGQDAQAALSGLLGESADRELSPLLEAAVLGVVHALAAEGPLVVWIDAAQWLDPASRDLLGSLSRAQRNEPLLLWVSARPDPVLEQALWALPRVDLGELSERDRRALVRSCFGEALVPEDIERELLRRAGGNPFFVIELIDAMRERGVLAIEGHAAEARVIERHSADISLPATVEDVVSARLAQLSEHELASLRWLAVAGGFASLELLSVLCARNATTTVRDLCAAGLVSLDRQSQVSFVSQVVEHIALAGIHGLDRANMQRRAHELMRAHRPYLLELACARELEHAGDGGGAARAYLEAAEQARAVAAYRDAVRYAGRALTTLAALDPLRLEAHLLRERAFDALGSSHGQRDEIEALSQLGERTGDPTIRAFGYARLASWTIDHGDLETARPLLARGWACAQASPQAALMFELGELYARLDAREGNLEAAFTRLDELGSMHQLELPPSTRANLCCALSEHCVMRGELARAEQSAADGLALARRAQDPALERNAALALSRAELAAGRYLDASALAEHSLALSRAIGGARSTPVGLLLLARSAWALGDAARAEAAALRARDAGLLLEHPEHAAEAQWLLLALARDVQDGPALARYRAELTSFAECRNDDAIFAAAHAEQAQRAFERGALDQAQAHAESALSRLRSERAPAIELDLNCLRALMLHAAGRPSEALELAQRVLARLRSSQVQYAVEYTYLTLIETLQAIGADSLRPETENAALAWVEACAQKLAHAEQHAELSARYLASPSVRALRALRGVGS